MDREKLAYLLWRYDSDGPYDPGEEPPELSFEQFREYSRRDHNDCKTSHCMRCEVEYWLTAAEWVIAKLNSQDGFS
jgi:hypothetical protein